MYRTILYTTLAALGLATAVYAATPKANLSAAKAQTRAELRSEGRASAQPSASRHVQATTSTRSSTSAPVTAADVGDADTFGRNVIWDGLIQTGFISMSTDCTPVVGDPPPGPDDHCITLNPAPAVTTFDLPDIGRMTLPGKSSKNILCHWLTPIVTYSLFNGTGAPATGRMRLTPYLKVQSEVLNDPSLIDPTTGLPFGGSLETGFSATYQNTHTMQPGETDTQSFGFSRVCIAGTISRQGLIQGYGLTDDQVTQFFKKPLTLRFGLRGTAALVNFASITYGLRIMGDKRDGD